MNRRRLLSIAPLLVCLLALGTRANGQTEAPPANATPTESYQFTVDAQHAATDIKSQGSTGTCWCFASASFLESELLRQGQSLHDLSEMFVVKNVYRDKAQNYVLRQGKANFSQGALAHDFINAVHRHGLVPEEVYSGLDDGEDRHDHSELESLLKGIVDQVVKRPRPSAKWEIAFDRVLDTYLGESPDQFEYRGETYTPESFAQSLGFDADNYVNITSYSHHPFHEEFVLEIPDNYSNGSFVNLPIDDVIQIMESAVANGYTLCWDGDVSEQGFSSGKGLAVLPIESMRGEAMKKPVEEIEVTQEMRQETLRSYVTTDDHLMHLVGMASDQNGTRYFIIKNSWGKVGEREGYLYMSEPYARLKTVSILVHRDAIPKEIKLTE